MGMYDNITAPEVLCPKCGSSLMGWQSKDGVCELTNIHYLQVNNFYTNCKCGAWIEFNRITPPSGDIDDYEMTVDRFSSGDNDG